MDEAGGSAMPRRRYVIVSGAPGAGKTTLAVPLAQQLGLALFSKDFIKETLTDALGEAPGDGGGGLAASRRIGSAAMELLWTLARHAPAAVLEANFRPRSAYERARLRGLGAPIVEVHCDCGPDETTRRFRERAAGQHAAHPLRELSPELLAEYDRPVGIGPVIAADTRGPVDLAALAARIETAFRDRS